MVEKLVSPFGNGLDIETKTAARILQEFLLANWDNTTITASQIAFGAWPDRNQGKSITLRCYNIISNEDFAALGGTTYKYNIPVAIDIFTRDPSAMAQAKEPSSLVTLDNYIRNFIVKHRVGLTGKGIDYIIRENSQLVPVGESEDDWFHLVIQVRMVYYLYWKDV